MRRVGVLACHLLVAWVLLNLTLSLSVPVLSLGPPIHLYRLPRAGHVLDVALDVGRVHFVKVARTAGNPPSAVDGPTGYSREAFPETYGEDRRLILRRMWKVRRTDSGATLVVKTWSIKVWPIALAWLLAAVLAGLIPGVRHAYRAWFGRPVRLVSRLRAVERDMGHGFPVIRGEGEE